MKQSVQNQIPVSVLQSQRERGLLQEGLFLAANLSQSQAGLLQLAFAMDTRRNQS